MRTQRSSLPTAGKSLPRPKQTLWRLRRIWKRGARSLRTARSSLPMPEWNTVMQRPSLKRKWRTPSGKSTMQGRSLRTLRSRIAMSLTGTPMWAMPVMRAIPTLLRLLPTYFRYSFSLWRLLSAWPPWTGWWRSREPRLASWRRWATGTALLWGNFCFTPVPRRQSAPLSDASAARGFFRGLYG